MITPVLVSVCGWASYNTVIVALAGAEMDRLPACVAILCRLTGAYISAKFPNRCEIIKLNRIVDIVLTIPGVITIPIKII